MYRLLGRGLGRGLLRAAGRRARGCYPRLLPGPEAEAASVPRARAPGLLPLLAVLAWFSKTAETEEEAAEQREAKDETEAQIIWLLKRAKLSIMKDEPEEAELLLHDALRLAFQSNNQKAITYTYDLMANLAFIRGQLENAEQLFKATMRHLLGEGMKQEDNAIIEISLKLASIYAAQNRQEFALAGYEFCISTLEDKIEREKELAEGVMSGSWFRTCAVPGATKGSRMELSALGTWHNSRGKGPCLLFHPEQAPSFLLCCVFESTFIKSPSAAVVLALTLLVGSFYLSFLLLPVLGDKKTGQALGFLSFLWEIWMDSGLLASTWVFVSI